MIKTQTKSKKIVKNKRLAISFSKDDPIVEIIKKLENVYYGMDVSSITKLAFVELLESKTNSTIKKIRSNSRTPSIEEDIIINEFINNPETFSASESASYFDSLKKLTK